MLWSVYQLVTVLTVWSPPPHDKLDCYFASFHASGVPQFFVVDNYWWTGELSPLVNFEACRGMCVESTKEKQIRLVFFFKERFSNLLCVGDQLMVGFKSIPWLRGNKMHPPPSTPTIKTTCGDVTFNVTLAHRASCSWRIQPINELPYQLYN